MFLDEIHGCDGRTACSQHGIGYHDGSLLNGVRKLAVVFVRLVCDFVAVKTDVTDFGRGNESEDSVHHAEAGTKDRNDGQLLPCDHGSHTGLDRSLDLNLL